MTTPGEFALKMQALVTEHDGDTEYFHIAADKLMVNMLNELGYGEGATLFERETKWYA